MTKRDLVILVAKQLGVKQNEVSSIVQEMLDSITDSLKDGNRVEVRNFGVFEIKQRDSRLGRNPRTGEEVPIPEKKVASFRPGKALKEWVQAGAGNRPHHLFKSDGTEQVENADAAPVESITEHRDKSDPPSPSGTQESLF
ncbi:MAG: integration host factor subunit beta [Candidatus Hydrogenedentota bacterium]|nr:MAG: integration host factor subunit beta [Candidatus Hydrogenedentota bacterium]